MQNPGKGDAFARICALSPVASLALVRHPVVNGELSEDILEPQKGDIRRSAGFGPVRQTARRGPPQHAGAGLGPGFTDRVATSKDSIVWAPVGASPLWVRVVRDARLASGSGFEAFGCVGWPSSKPFRILQHDFHVWFRVNLRVNFQRYPDSFEIR